MDRVLDRLWIGSTRDAMVPLRSIGFAGVVDLRDGDLPVGNADLAIFRLKNRDGDPWDPKQVLDALDFITKQVLFGRVLVMCAAGMSRSVSIVIGHLVRTGWSEADACELVRVARPEMAPQPKMLDSVLKAIREAGATR